MSDESPKHEEFIDPETGLHVVRETGRSSTGEPVIHEVITDRATGQVFTRGCIASVHTSVAEFMRGIAEDLAEQERGRRALAEQIATLSRADRVAFWTRRLSFQMRCQSEAGLDLLAPFDARWRAWVESVDPAFWDVLPDVCRTLHLDETQIRELLRHPGQTAEWTAARGR